VRPPIRHHRNRSSVTKPPGGAGRVGERATQTARPTLPSSNRRCGFPASGSPESSRLSHAQVPTSGSVPAAPGAATRTPLREVIGPLAAALQRLDRTALNMAFDLAVGAPGIPEGEVARPSFQMPIQLSNQDRDRLKALMTIRHFVQLFPFPLDRLLRRKHVQIFPRTSFQIAVVPKRLSRPLEFHHRPLAEPSVRLSPHSAPIRQTPRRCRVASERRDPTGPSQAVLQTGPPRSCGLASA